MKGFLVFHAKNDDGNLIKILQFLEVLARKKIRMGEAFLNLKKILVLKKNIN